MNAPLEAAVRSRSGWLPGCTPWPPEFAARYRAAGYWQGQTFGAMLRERAQAHPDRIAIVCGERRWSYDELDQRADALACGFRRLGLRPRDRVVVQLPNIAEFFAVCFALFRLGALPVFALPPHRRAEIGYFCRHAEAAAYVIVDVDNSYDYRQLAREVQAEAPTLKHVLVVGEAAEFTPLDALYEAPRPLPEPGADQIAFLQLSGGSTGLPKLIPRSHDDYLYSVRGSVEICRWHADMVYLCALPVAHNFPLSSPGTLGALYVGGRVVLARRPTPDECFPLIAAERVTVTALVPPLAMVWLDAATARRPDLSSLQLLQVGGARLSDAVAPRVRPVLGCALQQVFGMAEGLVNYTRPDDPEELVLTTQGRPISPDDEVRVVDDDDHDVPPGTEGHLLTRGPYTIRGYYRADEHNARAFTADGFYRTGDIVRRDEGGNLMVEGRAKDLINRGGEKISAEEIENLLLAHPAVREVAAVAMPHPVLGEQTCAYLVLRPDPGGSGVSPDSNTLDLAALCAYLEERRVARFKWPERLEILDALPVTNVGKVDKKKLRDDIAAKLEGGS